MLDTIKEIFATYGFTADAFLAALKFALDSIFGFVAKEEGFDYVPEV